MVPGPNPAVERPQDLIVTDSMWPWRHPRQCEPAHPDAVRVECTSDAPVQFSGPADSILLQMNRRLLVRNPVGFTCQLDVAQAGMLELIDQAVGDGAGNLA